VLDGFQRGTQRGMSKYQATCSMRIAFVTSLIPTGTPDTGFEIANACVLRALRDFGCTVTSFGFLRADEIGQPEAGSVVLDRIAIENATASGSQKLRWLMSSLHMGKPVISAKLAQYGWQRLKATLDQHGPFDAVICNSAPVAGAFPELMAAYPAILLAHNVEHVSARGNADHGSFINRILYRREARLLKSIEDRATSEARFVWCLAKEDAEGLGSHVAAKSAIIPLLTPAPPALPDVPISHDVGLIGTWTWQPNLVGLRWYLDEIAARLPDDITTAIAGRTPADVVAGKPNVTMLGRVPDAAEFVASSRVIALTSRTGTGIQLKTIETFQLGKPAVATLSSIRGFEDLPQNCLVADDPAAFASALTKLVRDVRAERAGMADGEVFARRQRDQLTQGIKAGLAAVSANIRT
jgi:glycosyltransferase involved in cell wall biosynthesis